MAQNTSMEEFEALLNESFEIDTPQEGSVVKGKVIAIEAGHAIIDVGYKMEGRVELKEFANPGEEAEVAVGEEVEVFLRQVENTKGEAVISREMARREEAWDRLEKAYAEEARVDGAIFGRVKGGFTVTWLSIVGYFYIVTPFISLILWAFYMFIDASKNKHDIDHKNPVFLGCISIILIGLALFLVMTAVTKISWNNYRFKKGHAIIMFFAYAAFTSWQFTITFSSIYDAF